MPLGRRYADLLIKDAEHKEQGKNKIKDMVKEIDFVYPNGLLSISAYVQKLTNDIDIKIIDRETAVKLIDKILVSAKDATPRKITIYYNFMGQY
jgi:hypothetical protein